MALSDTKVRNAKPHAKRYKIADIKGLFLLVAPNGSKLWRLKYFFNQKEKLLALGVYPEVSLAEAREKQSEARKLLANHIDPSEAKQQKKRTQRLTMENSYEAIAREWHEKFSSRWTPTYGKKVMRRLEVHVFPWLGHRPITQIDPSEILDLLARLEKKDQLDSAHRIRNICGHVFRYAIATRRAKHNPAADLQGAIPPVQTQHHPSITDPKKVGMLLHVIEGYDGHVVTKTALELAPLLFVRPGELRYAQWNEIDFDAAEWRIPAEKMKMSSLHIVPLPKQAIAALKALHPITGKGKYVFQGVRKTDRPISDNTINAALRNLGYDTSKEITGHGFRSMASTMLNEQGWNRERQLAHAERNGVRAAYNYAEYLPERRKSLFKIFLCRA